MERDARTNDNARHAPILFSLLKILRCRAKGSEVHLASAGFPPLTRFEEETALFESTNRRLAPSRLEGGSGIGAANA